MNDDNYFKSNLLEIVGIVLFMIMYALLAMHYLPLILFLFPTAFIFLGVRKGIVQCILSMLIVSIVIGITVDSLSGVILLVLFLPITMVTVYGIKSRRKPIEILSYTTAIFFISTLLLYGYAQNIAGVSIISQIEESFKQALSMQVEMFEDMGLTNYEILKTKDLLESGYKYILWILPAILIIFSLFISYSNYYAAVSTLRKTGIGIVSIPRFSKFKLPSNIMPGTVVMFLGVFLIRGLELPYYDTIFLNVVVIIWFMFLIQGLSVIDFFLIKLRLNLIMRILFFALLVVMAPLGTVISLIGIVDIIFDLRKIKKIKS